MMMKRGDVWTVAGGKDYAGKPRPVVIVQNDSFDETNSIVICTLTSIDLQVPFARPMIDPNPDNGLRHQSWVMVDKISSVPKSKIGMFIGRLSDDDLVRLNLAMLVFLGLASSPRTHMEPST
jgi:mRNA interferase MazF